MNSLSRFFLRLRWWWGNLPRSPRRKGVLVGIYLYWRERFTPAGKTVGALWLVALFLETLPGLSGLWPVLALLSGALLVAWAGSWRRPRGCVEIGAPPRARSGEELMLMAMPTEGGEGCHGGVFVLNDALRIGESSAENPWRMPLLASRPGCYTLNEACLLRSEPLGLMRSRRRCPQEVELVIHPRPAAIYSLDFLTQGASGLLFANALRKQAGRGGDFLGIRPYRPGDSLRDLHQLAFARYGQPYSREFAPEEEGGIALAFESYRSRRGSGLSFSLALSLCAGLAAWLDGKGWLHTLVIDSKAHALPPSHRLGAALDLLSRAANQERPRSGVPLPELRDPLLVVGCSPEAFRDSLSKPRGKGIKRIGVGSLRHIKGPLPDSHLWLDWYMLYSQLQAGKGLPL